MAGREMLVESPDPNDAQGLKEIAPVAWLGLDDVPNAVEPNLATSQARFSASITPPIHVARLRLEFFYTLLCADRVP
jgi:hypothetical protein